MRTRFTKIVATLGPATPSAAAIEELLAAGVDVARINMSHGRRAEHVQRLLAVRRAEVKLGRPIAVLQDLSGPKIRVGVFPPGGVRLLGDAETVLVPDDGSPGDERRIPVSLASLAEHVAPGTRILIDEGRIRLRVASVQGSEVRCRIEEGGLVTDHKGLNLPDVSLDVPPLTSKDLDDLEFGAQYGVDFVGLSFVRSSDDIELLRSHLQRLGSTARVVAKIERHEALHHLEEIIEAADAVMVARGDLGVEIAPELVPGWQKRIIGSTVRAGKEVITATQMLESMISSPLPTRAEASDVANAVWDGSSAVMLSGETAAGAYPVPAVSTMNRIVLAAEDEFAQWPAEVPAGREEKSAAPAGGVSAAIGRAACELAQELEAACIVCPTQTGATARQVARFRTLTPVLAATPRRDVHRQLALSYGVTPALVREAVDTDGTIDLAVRAAVVQGLASAGDLAVVTCGARVNTPGTTNLIKVERV